MSTQHSSVCYVRNGLTKSRDAVVSVEQMLLKFLTDVPTPRAPPLLLTVEHYSINKPVLASTEDKKQFEFGISAPINLATIW